MTEGPVEVLATDDVDVVGVEDVALVLVQVNIGYGKRIKGATYKIRPHSP